MLQQVSTRRKSRKEERGEKHAGDRLTYRATRARARVNNHNSGDITLYPFTKGIRQEKAEGRTSKGQCGPPIPVQPPDTGISKAIFP